MVLLDTNVVIYLHGNELDREVEERLRGSTLDTCNIIVAEVLGYRFIEKEDIGYFEKLFASMNNHIFDEEITKKVIELRQITNIKLPDAIIAAIALTKGLELWTHNTADFTNIPDLQVFDPLKS